MDELTSEEFSGLLAPFAAALHGQRALAVAVSGGPDSMALAFLLSRWAGDQAAPPVIHALIVDHGLRAESSAEAEHVRATLTAWPHVQPHVLKWRHDGVAKRIQEEARNARYALMAESCRALGVPLLFLGHHCDDQAETFLLRLAGGSGLDGLCAMRSLQSYSPELSLVRPLLSVQKDRLLATCKAHALPFVLDRSNECEDFARVRLRRAREILEREGLTSSRISTTVLRLSRARQALEIISEKAYFEMALESDTNRIVFDFDAFKNQPEEIAFRCLCRAMSALGARKGYPPRLERLESLFFDLIRSDPFRKRTLAGVVVERRDTAGKNGRIVFGAEKPEKA